MSRLAGKVAIITGAASGIGKAMARRFAAEGAAVLASDVDGARLERVVGGIVEKGGIATGQVADVSDKAAVEALIASALSAHGRLDILCNNAGVLDSLNVSNAAAVSVYEITRRRAESIGQS